MKTLFVHDGPIHKDENTDNYYGIAHNDKNFERYYTLSENLTVAMRVNESQIEKLESKYSKITVQPLEIVKCPNISNLKGQFYNKKEARDIISKNVRESDFIVSRIPSLLGFIAIEEAIKFKKPYIVELVACPWDAYWNHSARGKIVAPFMYFKTKRKVKNAKYVIYVTNNFLQKRYPTNGKNTSCSNVSLEKFNPEVLNSRLEKINTRMPNEKIVIGTTAAVNVRYKGQQYIIEALAKLKKQGYVNYEYQLVGGGDQSYLKSEAEKHNVLDQVVFLGPLPHEKVFNWLKGIDLYAQPSRQEGLPRALIEAMSKAVPALGAKTAGIPELLESNFVFSNTKRNIDEICSILLSLDKPTLIKQAKRNYEESTKYSKEIIEERRKKFFEGFLQDHRLQ